MRKSLLAPAGGNKFQAIKAKCIAAEAAGINVMKFTIGQPAGPAFEQACSAVAKAVMSGEEGMHEYQDNQCHPFPDFAKQFVGFHTKRDLDGAAIEYVPIPGIKSMLDVVVKSLGTWEGQERMARVHTMTKPGYGTPAYACKAIRGIEHRDLPMDPKNGFLFDVNNFFTPTDFQDIEEGDMIMLNFPHNPTGIIAHEKWLRNLCAFCETRGVRLFNDGAYHILAHNPDSVTLADVAIDFPNLNWAEAFSASKAGNFTGWRVGAIVGSPEFVGDIKRIKGESDSGFVAFAAAGVLELFENHRYEIERLRKLYASRLDLVGSTLTRQGMRLAAKPEAGFFLLFDSPSVAFDQRIENAAQFNDIMITKTGMAGVDFGNWIRYAICATDVEGLIGRVDEAFAKAQVVYEN